MPTSPPHARPEVKFRKPTFREADHPRDRLGRFIEVGQHVRLWGGGDGDVIRSTGGGRIEVARSDGQHVIVDAGNVTVTRAAPGSNLPQPPATPPTPDAPSAPDAPDKPSIGRTTPNAVSGAVRTTVTTAGPPRPVGEFPDLDPDSPEPLPQPQVQDMFRAETGLDHPRRASRNLGGLDAAKAAKANVVADLTERTRATPVERMHPDETVRTALADPTSRWIAQDRWGRTYWTPAGAGSTVGEPMSPDIEDALRTDAINSMVAAWATSANDHLPDALALQEVAAELFDLPHAPWVFIPDVNDRTYAREEDLRADIDTELASRREGFEAFLTAQYEATQERLSQHGITEVEVYRGFVFPDGEGPVPPWVYEAEADVPLRPMSSFTADPTMAHRFADTNGGAVAIISTRVPRERILSTPLTGVGCLDESEFVVLAGEGRATITAATISKRDTPVIETVTTALGDTETFENWYETTPIDPRRAAAAPDIAGTRPAPGARPDTNDRVLAADPDDPTAPTAWLAVAEDGAQVGYLRARGDDPASTVSFSDIDDWAAEVEDREITTRVRPDAVPGDEADDAPVVLGERATRAETVAVDDPRVDTFLNDDLFDDLDPADPITPVEARKTDPTRDAASKAKAEVVADLTRRMAHMPDEDFLTPEQMETLDKTRAGERVLIRTPNSPEVRWFDPTLFPEGFPEGWEHVSPEEYRDVLREQVVNSLVSEWATSSNGTVLGYAIQDIAQETFGIDDAHLTGVVMLDDESWMRPLVDAKIDEKRPLIEGFLAAQYAATQERFRAAGISEVTLYRGMKVFDKDDDWAVQALDAPYDGEIGLRPLSSFTTDLDTAAQFSGNSSTGPGILVTGVVPVERIIATPRTGVGCLSESEFVVIAGPGEWHVRRATTGDIIDDPTDMPPVGFDEIDGGDDEPEDISTIPAGMLAEHELADAFAAADPTDEARMAALTVRAQALGRDDLIPDSEPAAAPAARPEREDVTVADLAAGDKIAASGPYEGQAATVRSIEPGEDGFHRIVADLPDGTSFEGSIPSDTAQVRINDPADTSTGEPDYTGINPGPGRPDGTGTVDDPIAVGRDYDRAITLLAEGKHIRLDDTREVGTLLDAMAAWAKDAEARGEKAPPLNLCQVSVPGTNLFCAESKGVPRVKMPQLGGTPPPGTPAAKLVDERGRADLADPFITSLRAAGINVTDDVIPAAELKATQEELDGRSVANLAAAIRGGTFVDAPIFVTRDGYILDGHHRWAAKVAVDTDDGQMGEIQMPVRVVDMEIGAALDYANAFAASMGMRPRGLGERGSDNPRVGEAMDAVAALNPEIADAATARKTGGTTDPVSLPFDTTTSVPATVPSAGAYTVSAEETPAPAPGTRTIIFDIDGTIANVAPLRERRLAGEITRDQQIEMGSDAEPIGPVVDAMRRAKEQGYAVVAMTARPDSFRERNAAYLAKVDVPVDAMFTRADGDERPDADAKRDMIARLRDLGYDPVAAYDDKTENTDLFEAEGIPSVLVGGYNGVNEVGGVEVGDPEQPLDRWGKSIRNLTTPEDALAAYEAAAAEREFHKMEAIRQAATALGLPGLPPVPDSGLSDDDLTMHLMSGEATDEELQDFYHRAYGPAVDTFEQALRDEPGTTAAIVSAVEAYGGQMDGLSHRVKTVDSIISKIGRRALQRKNGLDDARAGVGDALRYSAIIPSESYASGINAVVDGLRQRGYDVPQIESMWQPGNPYRAIHADVVTPDGIRVELQFHTPESIATKHDYHRFYDIAREPSVDPQARYDAWQTMMDAWDKVPDPPNIADIGSPRSYPSPVDDEAVVADLIRKYEQAVAEGDEDVIAALRARASALGVIDRLPPPPD
jgi:hypothetical protein